MEPPGRRADLLGQARLDVAVDVLKFVSPGEAAALQLVPDLPQATHDRARVGAGDDALAAEHASVRDRGGDLLAPEAAVDRQREGVRFDERMCRLAEAATPRLAWAALRSLLAGLARVRHGSA